ncbi:MAG: hypothetical protein H0X29_02475, partial [Parachlamydiaceae bacterium]|nr:hypothetical protein [Parachlamydiaceae bacterium]
MNYLLHNTSSNSIYSPQDIFNQANVSAKICLFCHPNTGMKIHSTKNFCLLRVNFPVAPGHLMISSKVHYGSLGELDPGLIQELNEFKDAIADWFKDQYGDVLFYEHG